MNSESEVDSAETKKEQKYLGAIPLLDPASGFENAAIVLREGDMTIGIDQEYFTEHPANRKLSPDLLEAVLFKVLSEEAAFQLSSVEQVSEICDRIAKKVSNRLIGR